MHILKEKLNFWKFFKFYYIHTYFCMNMYVKKIIFSTVSDETKQTSFCQYTCPKNEITSENCEKIVIITIFFIKGYQT